MRRVKARTSPTALVLLLLPLLAASGAGCGAGDIDAVETPQLDVCPSADEYLADVYALMDAGGLQHIEGVIGGDLDRDARADLVATVIHIVGALEAGTFVALGALADAADAASDLEDTLAGAVNVVGSEGAGAPYPQALGAVRVMLSTCEGPPLLQLVLDLTADPDLLSALTEAVGTLGETDIEFPLDLGDPDTRPALRALMTNGLTALTGDDVDVAPLLDLVTLVLPDPDAPPWSELMDAVAALLAPGAHRDAIAGLATCLLSADPSLALLDLLLDVLDAVDLGGLLQGAAVEDPIGAAPADGAIDALRAASTALLELLIEDAAARRVIADLLIALVAEHVAAGVLGDLAALLEAHVIGDVVAVLGALATRSCAP